MARSHPDGSVLWYTSEGLKPQALRDCLRALGEGGLHLEPPPQDSEQATGSRSPSLVLFGDIGPGVCDRIRRLSRSGRVLAVQVGSETADCAATWELLGAGAEDVLSWPRDPRLGNTIRLRYERWQEIDAIIDSPLVRDNLVGRSRPWLSTLRQVVEVACFTEASVLITGATGTGKELVARLIHTLDRRPQKKELIILDCTTIVPELSGSEFFGHKRGAFTSSVADREGAFAQAQSGSLFLDEVGELPVSLQADLLRVVQEHTYKRVGGDRWRQTSFRLICATHQELELKVQEQSFRQDFYHRIATWRIHLPSLAERRRDILPLAQHFLAKLSPHGDPPELSGPVREHLLARDYPGNVRDLRQLVLQAGQRHVGKGPITPGDLPITEYSRTAARDWRDDGFGAAVALAIERGISLQEIKEAAADTAVEIALQEEDGNVRRAAERLAVSSRTLYNRRVSALQAADSEQRPTAPQPTGP